MINKCLQYACFNIRAFDGRCSVETTSRLKQLLFWYCRKKVYTVGCVTGFSGVGKGNSAIGHGTKSQSDLKGINLV